jgi:hypothetical protein
LETKPLELEIDQLALTDLVAKALDRPALRITDWKAQQLHGGMEWDSAVFRFQGQASDNGDTLPWSLVLKAVKPTQAASKPNGVRYWKREVLAYQSGLLHRLPGGNVSAPTCYDVQERPDGSIWLWMEDVREDIASPWSIEQFAVAARHFGQFNGAYLAGRELPGESWVTHRWLRQYVEDAAPMVEFIRSNPKDKIVMNLYGGDSLAQILAVWDEHEAILDFLDRLPQVFCHQDAFKGNLFTHRGKTIAIDWGYSGIAPVGAELVALVPGSIGMFEIPVDQIGELDQSCFESYLKGLREAGWSGDPKLVRMGYAITCLLRYPIGASVGDALPRLLNQESRFKMEDTFDKSADELEKTDPALTAYYQRLIPEAMKLLGMKKLASLLGRLAFRIVQMRVARKKET